MHKLGHIFALTAAAFIIAPFSLTAVNAQIGPTDLVRTEGETQVFIPCPFDSSIAPFWRINSTYYHHTRLPCPFLASNSPAGLQITTVDRSISGTTFQCLAPVNGVLQESSTGELTVTPLFMSDGEDDEPALEIELLYQQVRFTSQDVNLTWSILDKDVFVEDSAGETSTTYTVSASTCDLTNASVVTNTTETTTLFSTGGYEDAFFNITAYNDSGTQIATMDEPFRIESGVVTTVIPEVFVGRTCPVCVTVPQTQNAPFFNIPRSPSSNRHDSLCKTVRAPSETGRCLDFNRSCDGFADGPFSASLSVCSTTSSTSDYQMCFRNVTREMNGTKVHFFYSARQPCSITGARVTSWLYIDSYEMIVKDAVSISVSVSTNTTSGDFCVTSLPEGCYTSTVYNTTVYDVTGYYVEKASRIEDGVRTQLDALTSPSPECLPLLVEVDAYNPLVTYSETTVQVVGEGQATTSIMKCAKSRLKAPIVLTETADNGIQFNCDAEADTNIGFAIVAVDGQNQTTVFSRESLLTCDTVPNTIDLSNLVSCNTQYTVTARFAFPNGSLTTYTLSDTAISVYTGCPTTEVPTDGPTLSPLLALIIIPILAAIALIIIIILSICLARKSNSGSYQPRKVETKQMGHRNNQPPLNNQLPLNNQPPLNNQLPLDGPPAQGHEDGAHALEGEREKIDYSYLDLKDKLESVDTSINLPEAYLS